MSATKTWRVIAGVCCLAFLAADEPDSAADALQPWQDAVERFEEARSAAQEQLLRQFDQAEEKARAAGDLKKLTALKTEREAFLEKGRLPTSFKTTAYDRALEKATIALRAAAKKTQAALLRQKLDQAAVTVERQLEQLAKSPVPGKKLTSKKVHDGRVLWKADNEKSSEFRQVSATEWIQSAVDGSRVRFTFKEVARTPESVELYDAARKMGKRLKADVAEVCYDYREGEDNEFSAWNTGKWLIDPPGTVYLADLPELDRKTWDYQNMKDWGWSNTGRIGDDWIMLDNRPSPHGLFLHPAPQDFAMVRYEIGGLKKKLFRARYGIPEARRANPASKLTFTVLGDGQPLFTSKPMQAHGEGADCEVDISKIRILELRITCPGDASLAYACWFEPRLEK